ncbi:hypothetical protein ACX3YC_04745 [Pseudomonas mohnii]|jgi:hypothetical protein|uniref:hypothetical protein n=1 Tax=unclassified Pseudomonas TaxID=196821 RepID=UPI00102A0A8F|nr:MULTISPECIES: hypothetical protein [unclassified Pseudomonas]MBM6444397.1 hypothetical protein [Pseudomonas sp. MIL9]RZO09024.1 hypothetical protein EKG40_10145 [Pseudomonas moorei]
MNQKKAPPGISPGGAFAFSRRAHPRKPALKLPFLQQLKAFSNLAGDVRRDAQARPVNRSLIFFLGLNKSIFILFNG